MTQAWGWSAADKAQAMARTKDPAAIGSSGSRAVVQNFPKVFPSEGSLMLTPRLGANVMSPVGWHCFVAPLVQPVLARRGVLVSGLPLPARITDIPTFHLRLRDIVRTPVTDRLGAASILLTGARVGCFKFEDFANNRPLPAFSASGDFHAAASKRISATIMPEEFSNALGRYVSLLSIDDVTDTAELLEELHHILPSAANALLALQFECAAKLVRQSSQQIDAMMVRDTVVSMRRVQIAYWTRNRAMECAARLRCPYSFGPLDSADRRDMVRYSAMLCATMPRRTRSRSSRNSPTVG